ncbi:MAG: Valine-tRNA ligase [Candidatus Woesebacteria bacterium GW2011_GWA1_33_30]|uniref:Valine--tRNA ligase n=1 Tax=Candidatus Woesebacteria bacterium GW2011_GWA2_33_28 TaxID=1618561 RepID=A0A0G0A5J6_9BACT|nr:MAG: Valine-tRNA ligase [Candidatus Woesebacteria bacterium GW2011_GWA2_33_28]KKP47296.1 MAG: Valine-tRNA ligase [Candidatus Woesebacteria bacterium GW2011_GWA1_33_30]KKP48941.1 MAG: Valine-tRNA ligase [Microgenomates group bacterium GW2011_GWC1_33_32]KKP51479.1 MAG: Valine-tRNA ligase [Candidatus Woesebacteria bacterium GW2011_GWB1_33_38]KKP57482.1 MAG: Valine-tRNA ligase [Microgenomates group bacterium GW2011_GWD1_33_9]
MDKQYNHKLYEDEIYKDWEESGAFVPSPITKHQSPFTIVMPPPNANDPLHIGHTMFITIEDILIRFHRMLGESTLWLPGTDHAGIETQFVFEKKLAKKGQSRFDFDRNTLYKMIWDYVQENSDVAINQMKKLGASADWSKFKFTLDPDIVKLVKETFVKLNNDGLIYRGEKLVNYCTKCGTGYSELEVEHVEKTNPLYYIKYFLVDEPIQFITVATTRPEPIYVDTHLAINPKNKKTKHLKGKKVFNPITHAVMEIIEDDFVDPNFGTGIVKLTPAHDLNDFEIAQKFGLPIVKAIDLQGKLIGGPLKGKRVFTAREETIKILQKSGHVEKIDDNYKNNVGTCYRCHSVLELIPLEQFFIKVKPLADMALKALENKETVMLGAGQDKILRHWLKNLKDWNISRNIVWGIQIPAWYSPQGNYVVSIDKPVGEWVQETDTFDTWFSSGQWPYLTLKTNGEEVFNNYYPTTVMETGYDILPFWVMRMMLLGIYMTGKSPFKTVYLHGLVRDEQGRKMSKSIGNVINPLEIADKYGTDALRFALVMSSTPAQDKSVGENTFRGMRNFSNKIWNASRFVKDFENDATNDIAFSTWFEGTLPGEITGLLENYRIGLAAELLYENFWHKFCDIEIERAKKGEVSSKQLKIALNNFLKLLHPFMPFVTEAVWKELGNSTLLISERWPSIDNGQKEKPL